MKCPVVEATIDYPSPGYGRCTNGYVGPDNNKTVSMNRVTKGEKILEMMVSRGNLTPSGRDFLIAACDPMHDKQLENLMGWPDVESAPSVVRCIKQSLQIKAIEDGGSIVIMTHPLLTDTEHYVANRVNNMLDVAVDPSAVDNANIGAVTIARYGADEDFGVIRLGSSAISNVVGLPPAFATGTARLVGMGIEVNDVTADIYKQGTCTVFRLPQPHEVPQSYNILAAPVAVNSGKSRLDNKTSERPKSVGAINDYLATAIVAQQWEKWPNNLENAMLLSGTRQWKAAEGAYVVTPFCGQDNPPCSPTYVSYLMQTASTTGETFTVPGSGEPSNVDWLYLSKQYYAEAIRPLIAEPTRIAPIHSTGIILTGLNVNSTFTLQVNMFVETFPDISQQSIITLAKPSAQYDPVALELFSRAMGSLPVGVPASMNGLGDWFAGVVKEMAPMISTALTPFSPVLGGLASFAGQAANAYLAPPSTARDSKALTVQRDRARKKKANNPSRDFRVQPKQRPKPKPASGKKK